MTKRYYLTKASIVPGEEGNEVVLKASQYGTVVVANVPLDDQGNLIDPWCLCVLESDNHVAALADPDITGLPVYALDAKVSAMHTPTKTAMVNALKRRGIATDWIGNADGFREVVRTLGRMHNPAFNEDAGSWAL